MPSSSSEKTPPPPHPDRVDAASARGESDDIEHTLIALWQLLRTHPELKSLITTCTAEGGGGISIPAHGRAVVTLPYFHSPQDAWTAMEGFCGPLRVPTEEITVTRPHSLVACLAIQGAVSGAPITVHAWIHSPLSEQQAG